MKLTTEVVILVAFLIAVEGVPQPQQFFDGFFDDFDEANKLFQSLAGKPPLSNSLRFISSVPGGVRDKIDRKNLGRNFRQEYVAPPGYSFASHDSAERNAKKIEAESSRERLRQHYDPRSLPRNRFNPSYPQRGRYIPSRVYQGQYPPPPRRAYRRRPEYGDDSGSRGGLYSYPARTIVIAPRFGPSFDIRKQKLVLEADGTGGEIEKTFKDKEEEDQPDTPDQPEKPEPVEPEEPEEPEVPESIRVPATKADPSEIHYRVNVGSEEEAKEIVVKKEASDETKEKAIEKPVEEPMVTKTRSPLLCALGSTRSSAGTRSYPLNFPSLWGQGEGSYRTNLLNGAQMSMGLMGSPLMNMVFLPQMAPGGLLLVPAYYIPISSSMFGIYGPPSSSNDLEGFSSVANSAVRPDPKANSVVEVMDGDSNSPGGSVLVSPVPDNGRRPEENVSVGVRRRPNLERQEPRLQVIERRQDVHIDPVNIVIDHSQSTKQPRVQTPRKPKSSESNLVSRYWTDVKFALNGEDAESFLPMNKDGGARDIDVDFGDKQMKGHLHESVEDNVGHYFFEVGNNST
ncbi:unnamed protein product [Cyprideis torosa]|uniref:Uncharacterized protein n=1 Tax=Cyprideis torosa TaxID=163714 RepID=A0A7R8WC22_9CRUS|nr:unnamed protein product [Cyprideis torosa]CAG0887583.1 unnamed protein product [Cyprideis torosa]